MRSLLLSKNFNVGNAYKFKAGRYYNACIHGRIGNLNDFVDMICMKSGQKKIKQKLYAADVNYRTEKRRTEN